jgi:gluconolactonase
MYLLTRSLWMPVLAAGALFSQIPQTPPPQPPRTMPTKGVIHRLDPRLDEIIAPDAKIEVVASGFAWCEGPVWVSRSKGWDFDGLLFSDIPRNSVMRWDPKNAAISLFLKPSGFTGVVDYGAEPGSNGLTLDPQGRLVLFQHGDRRVARLERDGGMRTLADNYQGKRLNSPNDGAYHSSGALYFTDPPYGLPQREKDPRRELDHFGVYRLGTDGALTLLTKDLTRPNGIAFSPDEKTLYVAQSDPEKAIWMKFPVKGDGTLGAGSVLMDVTAQVNQLPGLPDGLKVDAKGNIFATGPGGVYIFAPDGKLLGRIETFERTSNCAWGDDGSTLYMTTDMFVTRVRTKTRAARW